MSTRNLSASNAGSSEALLVTMATKHFTTTWGQHCQTPPCTSRGCPNDQSDPAKSKLTNSFKQIDTATSHHTEVNVEQIVVDVRPCVDRSSDGRNVSVRRIRDTAEIKVVICWPHQYCQGDDKIV